VFISYGHANIEQREIETKRIIYASLSVTYGYGKISIMVESLLEYEIQPKPHRYVLYPKTTPEGYLLTSLKNWVPQFPEFNKMLCHGDIKLWQIWHNMISWICIRIFFCNIPKYCCNTGTLYISLWPPHNSMLFSANQLINISLHIMLSRNR